MTQYYLDTEFHEYKKEGVNTIELISIGIVESDREFYAINKDFDISEAWQNIWLRVHVLKPVYDELLILQKDDKDSTTSPYEGFSLIKMSQLLKQYGSSSNDIRDQVKEFVRCDSDIQFYAYYADYDWVLFCWLFGRMVDLPKRYPMYCNDLKQTLDEISREVTVTTGIGSNAKVGLEEGLKFIESHPDYPTQDNEHNALDDAKWNLALHELLKSL